jgi:N-acetylornithine carbamoyltransferase
MNRFLSLSELTDGPIQGLLQEAAELRRSPVSDVLRGKTIVLLFLNPSLRTLASFQAGVQQLGGSVVTLTAGSGTWLLETRDGVRMDGQAAEHVREAVPVLASYGDALGVRCFAEQRDLAEDLADSTILRIAESCAKPFINLESASDHPCQALADWRTLDDLEVPERGKFVLTWAYHPKALPFAVPLAAVDMALRRGMKVTICHPPGFDWTRPLLDRIGPMAGRIDQTTDRREAFADADAVYVKSWCLPTAYGDPEADARARQPHRDWCVDEGWFEPAKPLAPFMHCLPIRRNVKATDRLLDGPRSAVLRQAENRLHVQKAVLARLLGVTR